MPTVIAPPKPSLSRLFGLIRRICLVRSHVSPVFGGAVKSRVKILAGYELPGRRAVFELLRWRLTDRNHERFRQVG